MNVIKYKIFQLVKPEELYKKIVFQNCTVCQVRTVLQEIQIEGFVEEHNSMKEALSEITRLSLILNHIDLTIIPIISIRS